MPVWHVRAYMLLIVLTFGCQYQTKSVWEAHVVSPWELLKWLKGNGTRAAGYDSWFARGLNELEGVFSTFNQVDVAMGLHFRGSKQEGYLHAPLDPQYFWKNSFIAL